MALTERRYDSTPSAVATTEGLVELLIRAVVLLRSRNQFHRWQMICMHRCQVAVPGPTWHPGHRRPAHEPVHSIEKTAERLCPTDQVYKREQVQSRAQQHGIEGGIAGSELSDAPIACEERVLGLVVGLGPHELLELCGVGLNAYPAGV